MVEAVNSMSTDAAAELPRALPAAERRPARNPWLSRAVWAVLFVIPTAIIALSAWLTMAQLDDTVHPLFGLPPCGFKVVTGLPCPGCGLTHCFTAMAHLDIFAAVNANPFGVLLFLVSLTTIPVAAVGFVKNWPVVDTLERLQFDKWAILLSLASILTWMVRVATILATS